MALPEPQILRYTRWLRETRKLDFDPTTTDGYDRLWRWSVDDLPAFWSSVWDYFEVESPAPPGAVLVDERMPGARWFPGTQVSYPRQLLRHVEAAHRGGHPAIVFQNERLRERGEVEELSWPELKRQVGAFAAALQALGVGPNDRVCAFLPNVPETAVAFLAVASLGAIWSVCSPDMGPLAVLDRFRQIEPKVLIVCDGYRYGGIGHDRLDVVRTVADGLPTVTDLVLLHNHDRAADPGRVAASGRRVHDFDRLVAGSRAVEPVWVDFDHPLWVVYSSGTTGLPKAIVHGHGSIVVESLKFGALHNNVGASIETADRYHWYSSTGWIMWNSQLHALLGGTTVCMYDGHAGGPRALLAGPERVVDLATLWRFAGETGVTFFGAGSAFYSNCLKAGLEPRREADLSTLRALGATGSPLPIDCYEWVYAQMPKVDGHDIWLNPISGGTDFAGAFVGGMATLPVVPGEMQVRCLGAAVEAWSEPKPDGRGRTLVDEVGELVCTKPMPSMPLYFWGDFATTGKAAGARDLGSASAGSDATRFGDPHGLRFHDSYFDMYPGVWRHGDWIRITPRGGAIIYGRSDATINRHGIRMGTAELYRAVEAVPEVLDSIVVDLEYLGHESYMPLFVVLRDGVVLDEALTRRLKTDIRAALSARHVPNEIFAVDAIPRTLSGKKMELPVKKLLMGTPPEQVFKLDAMANADCVAWFVEFAARRRAGAQRADVVPGAIPPGCYSGSSVK